MNDKIKTFSTTDVLKHNVRDLQEQLTQANKRIFELNERTSKLMKEREFNLKLIKEASKSITDIKGAIKAEEQELQDKIQKQIDDWPEVVDSRPEGINKTKLADEKWLESSEWKKV